MNVNMQNSSQPVLFAAESLRVAGRVPETTTLRSSSRDLGWKTILFDDFETHGAREEHCEAFGTPDVRISVGLTGAWDLWAIRNGRWASAVLGAGSVNVRASGDALQMRWRNRNANRNFRVASAYLPPVMLEEAADHFRRPGQRLEHRVPTSIVLNDQVIASTITAMVNAAAQGADNLYAEQATRWLATHLIHTHGRAFELDEDDRQIGSITDARLARVLEYIRANLAEQVSVTELANVAAVSPFHFCRLFSRAVGMSPHRYLVDRRMQRGEALLRTTDISLSEVANQSGYICPNAFSVAFRRRYGMTPTSYRRASRE
jgi:AraC family transcriptional regulator